ncbi:MAG: DUF4278 domain-containing protein [Cyanobacteria bacterium P01_H01_bin.15]
MKAITTEQLRRQGVESEGVATLVFDDRQYRWVTAYPIKMQDQIKTRCLNLAKQGMATLAVSGTDTVTIWSTPDPVQSAAFVNLVEQSTPKSAPSELANSTPKSKKEAAKSESSAAADKQVVITYRGQKIVKSAPSANSSQKQKKVRTYRGVPY